MERNTYYAKDVGFAGSNPAEDIKHAQLNGQEQYSSKVQVEGSSPSACINRTDDRESNGN